MEAPFVPSLSVEFRKRLTDEILIEINEILINDNSDNDNGDRRTGKDYLNPAKNIPAANI